MMKLTLPYVAARTARCFVLLLFFLPGFPANAATFTGTLTATAVHGSCYNGSMSVNYTVSVPSPVGYTYGTDYTFDAVNTSFDLRDAYALPTSTALMSNTGGTVNGSFSTISGSFTISGPGTYTVYPTVIINDITAGRSVVATVLRVTITVGYETAWADLLDTEAQPNSYSSRRLSTATGFGEAQSSNYIAAGTNGWIETGAQFGTGSTRSLYALLNDYSLTTAFAPANASDSYHYVEFREGGTATTTSGEGIYVRAGTTVYKLQGILITDRIRIERTSGTVRFYKQNTTTALSGVNVSTSATVSPLTVNMTNGVFTLCYAPNVVGDGLSNVIMSASCTSQSTLYARLERQLSGVNYKAPGTLYFSYDEEYAPTAATTLSYKIFNSQRQVVQHTGTVSASRVYGDNRYALLVSSLPAGTYILEVTNEKKEVFYLRFTKQ